MAKLENSCPQIEFVRLLASKLSVTLEVAEFIYKTYGVVGLELMQQYDSLKITPYIFLERKQSPSREFFNIHTGEYEMTESKDRLYARVSHTNKEFDNAMRHIEAYEEMLTRQEIYEAQKEQERLAREQELEKDRKREKRNRQARQRRKRKNQRAKRMAMERLIHYEMIYHKEEQRKYSKELAKRKK